MRNRASVEDVMIGFKNAFWAGTAHDLPSIAYAASLNNRRVKEEAVYLRSRFGRRMGLAGIELPADAKHCWFGGGLKLWASWDHENHATYEVRTLNKEDVDEKGDGLICTGQIDIPLADFKDWCRLVVRRNGIAMTLLNELGEHCFEKITMLVERFSLSMPDESPTTRG